jgi:catechol 2,3-dioxygenase-like lactoylglutathione lyase family enzyme
MIEAERDADAPATALTTIALRTFHHEAMLDFYGRAFGIDFGPVETGPIVSQFGSYAGLTLKFVPIREGEDFEDFPSHQLGFEVSDVRAIIELAVECGGRTLGEAVEENGRLHGSVRDPDGNTLELYGEAN